MAQDLQAELLAAERAVWDALAAGDEDADRNALAPEFLGVYPSGFGDRDEHANQLSGGPTVVRYELTEARILPLGPEYGLLAYRADYLRPGRDTAESMYVSSVWRRDGAGWIHVFSQDTPVSGQWSSP